MSFTVVSSALGRKNPPYHLARRYPGHKLGQDDLAAAGLYRLAADDALFAPVLALD
jgi:hypothetical protein